MGKPFEQIALEKISSAEPKEFTMYNEPVRLEYAVFLLFQTDCTKQDVKDIAEYCSVTPNRIEQVIKILSFIEFGSALGTRKNRIDALKNIDELIENKGYKSLFEVK